MEKPIRFKQKLNWFTRRECIAEDGGVTLTTKALLKSNRISVKYENILPEVYERRDFHVTSFIGFLLSTVAALLFLYLYLTPDEGKTNQFYTLAIMFGLIAFYCLFTFDKKSYSLVYLKLRNGGMLAFNKKSPSKEKVQDFLDKLIVAVKSIRFKEGTSDLEKLNQYKELLEFLYREGVILEEELLTIINRLNKPKKTADIISIVKT